MEAPYCRRGRDLAHEPGFQLGAGKGLLEVLGQSVGHGGEILDQVAKIRAKLAHAALQQRLLGL